MEILSVYDSAFKPYGRVVEGYPTEGLVKALATTPCTDGVVYLPRVEVLHSAPNAAKIGEGLYGGMPYELGYCNGHNTKLNCLEFHRDSEFNLGTDDFILLLATLSDLEDGELDTAKVKAFKVPAGVMVEVYATTLHYAPCHADAKKGFRVMVALPDQTNTDFRPEDGANKLDKTLWARNKWLLAHPDSSEAKQGAAVLLKGENIDIAGDIYTEDVGGIAVHRYGAHIFHTDDEEVWQYANRFATFNRFTNAPLAKYQDRLYHMPFNMNTFYAMWGVTKPNEAREIIERQRKEITGEPQNLEEQAISLVGRDIYEALVRGYSEKQWGRPCRELPAFIIRRLPVRFTYDNNYFNDRYQGIPDAGYTAMVEKMLDGIEVRLNVDFLQHRAELTEIADKIVYTGPIDQYYDQCFGALNYRSLRFETQDLPMQDYQGNAVINDTNADVPYTRVIEHKHFAYGQADVLNLPHTVVTYEYPADWKQGDEPYYPVNDAKNGALYEQYRQKAAGERNVIFGGRLGQYRYLDMDDTLRAAIDCARKELE